MTKAEEKEYKYGVEEFAKEADVETATARVMLRKAGVKKHGSRYGWDSMSEVKAAVAKCRDSGGKAKKKEKKSKAPAKKARKRVKPAAAAEATA